MTAPHGAPGESGDNTADNTAFGPEEPTATAFGVLSRAQFIANRLRREVEAEVAALRTDATAAHDEARRLLIEASDVHEDALSDQRSAAARLHERSKRPPS